ncbi:PKD domain-containing protein [Chishuiella sp.]|uniref:PKD domain-containing protein n=1 Tax=Chishuiella sp. TaxID=1969467 RepID=UPI0028ACF22B|nr:PKD domain-containing protein [Chishuiella sp.]
MNYIQKNKTNIIIGITALSVITILLYLWFKSKNDLNADEINAQAYPNTINVGDSLIYKDNTKDVKTLRWHFGDGITSDDKSGVHFFKKPGYYQVTVLINNKYPKTFPILVSPEVVKEIKDSVITTIDAPTTGMQFANVLFSTNNTTAKEFRWKFGESGNIDSFERNPSYSYKKPGVYLVTLYTDEQLAPITHRITITKSFDKLEDKPVIPKIEEDPTIKINNDFKYHLQQIANGNNFNDNYNYLLKTYLCNKDNAQVVSNDKINNFYYYTTGLQFDKNNTINEVKVTLDNNQNCVNRLEVKQTK